MNVLPPRRVRRSATIHHPFPPADVFPQLCPVREVEWASGWEPIDVYTESGVIEPGCVFTTREAGGEVAVWSTTRHDPVSYAIEFVKVTPGLTSARISIALEPRQGGDATAAHVVYEHTSLGPEGDRFVEEFTEERFAGFMQEWKSELDHQLSIGGRLDDLEHGYE